MEPEKLKQIVLDASQEVEGKRKLACAKAFALSQEHSVALGEIGRICNESSVKIGQCQLGCFR